MLTVSGGAGSYLLLQRKRNLTQQLSMWREVSEAKGAHDLYGDAGALEDPRDDAVTAMHVSELSRHPQL